MEEIKAIKLVTFIENCICVYRNYAMCTKRNKKIISLRIIVEIIIVFFVNINNILLLHKYYNGSGLLYIIYLFLVVYYINYMFCIFYGALQGKAYRQLIFCFNKINAIAKRDKSYKKSLARLKNMCIVISIALLIISALSVFVDRSNSWNIYEVSLRDSLLILSKIHMDFFYHFEYVVYFTHIKIFHLTLRYLNSRVKMAQFEMKMTRRDVHDEGERNIRILLTKELTTEWAVLYKCLVFGTKTMKSLFGLQMLIAMVMSFVNFTLSLYGIILICSIEQSQTASQHNLLLILTYYTATMLLIFIVAQSVYNEVEMLKRNLARMYNILAVDSDETQQKLVKDFLRMVYKNKVEIKMLSIFPVGMPMLTFFLSLSASYVVVMVQFSNVF
uniref:Gustatory receptor n=1 Tax=Bombyx mori TaxID=7091 RepID=B7FF44_BOMMO|nr:TPA_inf: gustatory receptor 57 [Bombyx mori]